ncbi:MAG: hypothetical protein COS99_04740 [Candidatus Omnitrophica bacterium CG07_land_8_20_14_0_80_42_15]|uniref:Uncharacterized protein n=1 Tax=Candidatus Aquitaenariimonas noxiae TaxID=1974741 RepID=A0A2J0KSS6_9BACT|nr:MAG: hypothetical protein COS99_04740 [Candidatus Omnitrophica bacterium CG07_land_8_20_14_0_80_42_15]
MGKAYRDSAIEGAFGEIRKVERIFSLYDPDSELFRLNKSRVGQSYAVSKEFMFLLKEAKRRW